MRLVLADCVRGGAAGGQHDDGRRLAPVRGHHRRDGRRGRGVRRASHILDTWEGLIGGPLMEAENNQYPFKGSNSYNQQHTYISNHHRKGEVGYSGVILLKEYQFFPKKDQNQTTFWSNSRPLADH